jgi:hypothetical protein
MRPIEKIGQIIDSAPEHPAGRSIRGLLRIRREEFEARPFDARLRLFLLFVLVLGSWYPTRFLTWPRSSAIAMSTFWVLFLAFWWWRYPTRDRLDAEERTEIDEHIRRSLAHLAPSAIREKCLLDKQDKRTLLEIYERLPLPEEVRYLVRAPEDLDWRRGRG